MLVFSFERLFFPGGRSFFAGKKEGYRLMLPVVPSSISDEKKHVRSDTLRVVENYLLMPGKQ
jgi:hypothetical protein